MKFPKNRASVFVVLREDSVLGVFADLDDAEDFRGASEQEWIDKTGEKPFIRVTISTFYG